MGGVCGAISKAAVARELQAACRELATIKTGKVAITYDFALRCKYIIRAVGQVYNRHEPRQSEDNRSDIQVLLECELETSICTCCYRTQNCGMITLRTGRKAVHGHEYRKQDLSEA
ncbi:MAG TPA: macro domain-containing protein [Clostridia bacterium]|nr:macro domain-containing protein [Clostridia bacterium]